MSIVKFMSYWSVVHFGTVISLETLSHQWPDNISFNLEKLFFKRFFFFYLREIESTREHKLVERLLLSGKPDANPGLDPEIKT